jgi:uncharacterized membrane protein
LALGTLAGVLLASHPAQAATGDAAFSVTTPYPNVETQPGSDVTLDINVTSREPDAVDLAVDGLPDGWTATMRGGGFVVHAVTAMPDTPGQAQLEVHVPPAAEPGSYPIMVAGSDGAAGSVMLPITLDVEAEVDNGIQLTADFPRLKGDPASDFTYTLTITNNTPSEQTFTFAATAPKGWTATASPSAQARAETVTIDAGSTGTVTVTATPPTTAQQGEYPIDVAVSSANGGSGHIKLTAEVTGSGEMTLATADQRLDVSGRSNSEERIPMIVSNTGTADLQDVKLAGTAPTGWDVSFQPETLASVKPNETAQVTAIVKPASGAVAGDYALTVRSSAGSQSSNVDLRYQLHGSRTLGIVAIAVIVAAFLALAGVFVRFGRR